MKKLLFLLFPVLLLVSCNTSDHKITSTSLSTQGSWVPVTDGTGKIVSNKQVFATFYTVAPSFSQKYQLAKAHGQLAWCYVLAILGIISIVVGAVLTFKGVNGYISVASGVLAVILFASAAGTIDWAHTKESPIPKVTYDSLMKADGSLKVFWDQNLYK